MKYFIDTEFIEGFNKPFLGKKRHFIDLISIGIVAEDGRTYYAVSNEFNAKDADDWVYKNVIQNIELEWVKSYSGDGRNKILDRIEGTGKYGSIRIMQNEIGKSNKQIAQEVFEFCAQDTLLLEKAIYYQRSYESQNIEFYGYYSDYDWVLFCSLFGRMIDLPKGFPMYCKDLKQMLDDKCALLKETPKTIKELNGFPKQDNEHNALDDAKWNLQLYKFIQSHP